MSLGAVVISYNEEENIARCLESLSFCDEIVVVDAKSTDKTVEIAKKYTPKIHVKPWKGYVEQKNEAVSLCSCDWVLSLDVDEVVSSELKSEIIHVLTSPSSYSGFSIPRKTMHFGRWIKYGGWYPNLLVRLFRKSEGRWVGGELHERWETKGTVGRLRNDLIHFSFRNLADQVARNNRYSSLGAEKLMNRGVKFSLYKMITKTVSKFIETYMLKRGFLDGYPGFIISVSAAYSVYLKWAKLWEMQFCESK